MDTPPQPPDSQLRSRFSVVQLSNADAEKAWHLLALLLSHGRPADPSELASKCTLFCSDPELINFLCSIPNSPIRLAHNNRVTFSQTGLTAVTRFFANFNVTVTAMDSPVFVPRLLEGARSSDVVRTYCRKRKRVVSEIEIFLANERCCGHGVDEEEIQSKTLLASNAGFRDVHAGVLGGYMRGRYKAKSNYSSIVKIDCQKLEKAIISSSMPTSSTSQQQDHESMNTDKRYSGMKDNDLKCHSCRTRFQSNSFSRDRFLYLLEATPGEKLTISVSHPESPLLHCTTNRSEVTKDVNMDLVNFSTNINHGTSSWLGVDQRITLTQSANGTISQACGSLAGDVNGESNKLLLRASNGWDVEDLPTNGAHTDKCYIDRAVKSPSVANNVVEYIDKVDKKNSTLHEKRSQAVENCMAIGPHTELEQHQRDKEPNQVKHRTKRNCEKEMDTRGNRETMEYRKGAPSISTNNDTEHKPFPDFESFVVEEEEGSGGYGTVYRAKRKSDGIIFAIKYPHVKANRNHVHNELKMLQRVGGKNFVIKYEGSFKSGDSDCLVLEHVKHDRPEVLKREINIFQLQWYGYCMFRSLAGLHKLGIVHRDVKPGNFLFSRTANKGYLIDFNLAMDLHRKQGASDNPKSKHDIKTGHIILPRTKYLPPIQDSKSMKTSFPEAINHSAVKGSKSLFPPRSLKKVNQAKVITESNYRNINKSQGADGSGITSAKDVTSTRTPSAERLRQPMPSTCRAELISLAHEALQGGGGNHEPVNAPTSKRKRVAASPQTTDSKCFYPTPMPLHASGIAVHGAGLLRSNDKHRREGPCVGTKGFRAPEVLFKSAYQGPKVDIWSAGVTLLYLMIGRTPFTGEPDQNIKEIAKLRGSEELWEVAKLHNQESLFPPELFEAKHLLPVKLRDWCARNARRPDFQEVIPRSLFDLVDKCLTVNPRLRITAEEALRHEFFVPCHELLRKQRLRRRGLSLDPRTTRESQACDVKQVSTPSISSLCCNL